MSNLMVEMVLENDGQIEQGLRRIEFLMKTAARPLRPVVNSFAKALEKSIRNEFRHGGLAPFTWPPNARNTIAGKGHGHQLYGRNRNRSGILDSTRVTTKGENAPIGWAVQVHTSEVGLFNRDGVSASSIGVIRPKHKKALRFVVAESQGQFLQKRKKALAKRRAGVKTKIPARPGTVVVFAKKVTRHPGIPQRKFAVVRPGLIRTAWEEPVRRFLFGR